MADDNVFTNTCQFALDKFGVPAFKESQKDGSRELISGQDVLVLQPTGSRENPSCFSLFPWCVTTSVHKVNHKWNRRLLCL